MYYLIYITEKCNLFCKYCDSAGTRILYGTDFQQNLDHLVDFLNRDPEVSIKLYGGEPLLGLDIIEQLLRRVRTKKVTLQTNGTLLHTVPRALFSRIDCVSVSIDGPDYITDTYRGTGVQKTVLEQVTCLRERGYPGGVDVRMTISPGVSVADAVGYFFEDCPVAFDRVHWQLNVLFDEAQWRINHRPIKDWFKNSYNPEITQLVDRWIGELVNDNRLVGLVPFASLIHDLITGDRVSHIRCGSGVTMWTITPDGLIYPCPIMRDCQESAVGSIEQVEPQKMATVQDWDEPCKSCRIFDLCGGRCLYANQVQEWGLAGQGLVCGSIRHLFRELARVAPIVETLLATEKLSLQDLCLGGDYEEIP